MSSHAERYHVTSRISASNGGAEMPSESTAAQQTSARSHELRASLADLRTTADRLLQAAQQFTLGG